MSYNALYRKYRPSRFSEVVGQEHITEVLRNQIRSGRFAHAYLFSGSRGTGKTSTARILARAINCLDPQDGEPCLKCEACLKNLSESIDVIELDAASNSGVDQMRSIIEKAEFAPINLNTKIYIIDEAHMLSRSAENALLKTLEEPPEHVVFILATTEPQALAATILSRCQRYEFKRLSVENLANTTRKILKDAGAEIEDGALMAIARAAEGGMRDCLSIADQCLSLCGSTITESDVLSVLGSVNSDFLFEFADAVINGEAAGIMLGIDRVVSGGRDLGVFIQDVSTHFRSLLFAKVLGSCTEIIDCTKEMMQRYIEQAETTGKARLERTLSELMKLQQELKFAIMPRVLLESSLLAVCHPEESKEAINLTDRLEQLENKLKNGSFAVVSSNRSAKENEAKTETSVESSESGEALEKGEPVPPVVSNSYPIPAASAKANELYNSFISAAMQSDMFMGMQIQASAAHWCDSDTLYICFDKSKALAYNTVIAPSMKSKLQSTAAMSIAPFGVEVIFRGGSVKVDPELPAELFGVKITEEE
ncbi:MAG: DNA polymerase III subunit gamma/tau [Clostridia bacterium]|nr:DNA polymerase III subunit gamma/tau [Clostridia bacterium]